MKDWLTAREIAALKLPGLPRSKRGIQIVGSREGWQAALSADGSPLSRERQGRGGGFEFHVSLLPQVSRTRLEARAGRDKSAAEIGRDLDMLKASDVSRRDARLFAVARAEEFHRSHPALNRAEAFDAYAAVYNANVAEVPQWVRGTIPETSGRTLRRWRQFREASRLDLVAGRHSLREGCRQIERLKDGDIAAFIGALIVKQPFLTAPHIRAIVEGRYGAEIPDLPSERTFQRFVSDWKETNALALRKLTDPDGYKSHSRLSGSNSNAHVTALNQLWEVDASPADVLTTDGRHAIYALIDIWSRRLMVFVTKTPRTEATLLLVRRAVIAWGVPQTIRTDNGSDFTSQRFVSAMNSMGIAHDITDPFSPEQKGTVERAIGTLQRGLMTVLPGFVGHSVEDRKKIEQRKAFAQRLGESDESAFCVELSADELQHHCDEWCNGLYAHAAHRGLDGETPFARAASFKGTIARVENERALDLLLAPVAGRDGWRQATKQGLRLDAGWFISPDLLPGMRVYCRQDPEDMGRLYCFESEGGAYITTAICPERAGIDPKAAIKAAQVRQAEIIEERTRDLRSAARRIKPRDMVDWLHAGARRKSASVTAFPHKSTVHNSDALTAAGEATDGVDLPAITQDNMPVLAAKIVPLPETPKQRFTRAVRLEACVAAGDPVSTEDALWLGSYATTAEYRSHKAMLEDFGPEAVLEKN